MFFYGENRYPVLFGCSVTVHKDTFGEGGGQVFDIGEAKNILGGGGFLQTF